MLSLTSNDRFEAPDEMLETDFLLQRAVTFQYEPPTGGRTIFDRMLQTLGLQLSYQELESKMSRDTSNHRLTVTENLDDGPRESFHFDDFVGLRETWARPGKSFRAKRLYHVDAGGASRREHRSDYRRA